MREEADAGRPLHELVVLVRATTSLRLYEQALEEQGLADVRGRRPRLLGAGAGARRRRLPLPAGQRARRGRALRRARLPVLRRGHRRAGAARGGRPRRRPRRLGGAARGRGRAVARRAARGRGGPAAGLRPLRRRRAAARRAAPGRGAARARHRPHGLRPRDPRPRGRRPPAREPAQAHAARPRVRAGGGPRPARLPRLRGRAGPGRGARGRGRARVRRARRRAADDDPPRQGARVPRGLRRRSRPRRATRRGRGCSIGDDGRAGLKLATLAGGEPVPALGYDAIAAELARGRVGRGAAAALRRRHPGRGAADPLGRRRHGEVARARGPGGPPMDWLAPALLGEPARAVAAAREAGEAVVPCGQGGVAVRLVTAASLPPEAAAPAPRGRARGLARARRCPPSRRSSRCRARSPRSGGSPTRSCRTTRAAAIAST